MLRPISGADPPARLLVFAVALGLGQLVVGRDEVLEGVVVERLRHAPAFPLLGVEQLQDKPRTLVREARDLLGALGQLPLGAPALADVADAVGVGARSAVLVEQGRREDLRPEGRAVRAHPRRLVLVCAAHPRRVEDEARLAIAAVRLREEDRAVAPHDLLARISEDALGPQVPRQHHALQVEREDRRVAHLLDHELERLALDVLRAAAASAPLPVVLTTRLRAARASLALQPGYSSSPRRIASATAAARSETPSFS